MTLEERDPADVLEAILRDLQDTLAQSQRAVRLMTTALLLMAFTVMLNLIVLLVDR